MLKIKSTVVALLLSMAAGAVWATPVYTGPMDTREFRVREGIGNVLAKIRAGKPVSVAYFGGSITQMDGWRRLSMDWLKAKYPTCAFTEIAAAIGGTGSDLGVYRYRQDVLAHKPDLVFVEFATNDRGRKPEAIWRNFEGIVRQTWQADPKTDIVFVYTITAPMMEDYGKGVSPRAASAMDQLADHFGIPSVDFGWRVAADVRKGRLVMSMGEKETAVPKETPNRDRVINEKLKTEGKQLFARDGVHPALPGHGYYLESVKSAWAAMEELPAADHAKRLKDVFFDASLADAKMEALAPTMLTGDWRRLRKGEPQESFASRFGGSPCRATKPGSKLKFRFKGTRCKLYDLLGPACGQLWITVDGRRRAQPVPRFDSYCTYYRLACMDVYDGPGGIHDVEIELDRDQPSRQSVAFRLRDPKKELSGPKYNGTEWYVGRILIVGELADVIPAE